MEIRSYFIFEVIRVGPFVNWPCCLDLTSYCSVKVIISILVKYESFPYCDFFHYRIRIIYEL